MKTKARALPVWRMESALVFCRQLSESLQPIGICVGLTGSILLKGESTKDLDVLLFPASSYPSFPFHDSLDDVLWTLGMKRVRSREEVTAKWRKKGSVDTKWVEEWVYAEKRVDLFFVK